MNYINGFDVVYWINLERSEERRKNMELMLQRFSQKHIRINAVDGKNLPDNEIFGKFKNLHPKCSKVEYACSLSHLNAIQEFNNSDYDVALILEDDMTLEFEKYWDKSIENIVLDAPKDWDIIMLTYIGWINLNNLYTENHINGIEMWSTGAYIINKKGGEKLYDTIYKDNMYALDTHHHQLDYFLYKYLKTYVYKYPYFIYKDDNDSSIHTNHLNGHISSKNNIVNVWNKYNSMKNNKLKILFTGFWSNFNYIENPIYMFGLKDKNYDIKYLDLNQVNDDVMNSYNIIIVGVFYNNKFDLLLKHRNKVVLYITEPIEFCYKNIHHLYVNNVFRLSIGTIQNDNSNIKIPHYIDYGFSVEIANKINNEVMNITLEELKKKNFCCLINRHDNGNTRRNIYNKLSSIKTIVCPSKLLNNFPNDKFEQIGPNEFRRQFIFNICPENYVVSLNGYVTEKIWLSCQAGNIPIYYGKLDEYDKKIFNMNRVIVFDPTSDESINNAYMKVKELMNDDNKLLDFYKQQIFLDTSEEVYNFYRDNLNKRLNNFILG